MKKWLKSVLAVVVLASIAVGVYHNFKPMPAGLNYSGLMRAATAPAFLVDSSYVDPSGSQVREQEIFDEVLRLIGQAERLIVMDMFLFNGFGAEPHHRPLHRQLTQALIERKTANPAMPVVVITDPINTVYGGLGAEHLDQLRAADVTVVITNLAVLRDSNPTWSGLWRVCCQWLGNDPDGGWLPNVFGAGEVTLRSYLALPNFKANHRKTLVVDEGDGWTGLVSSANPHDASSDHSNTALRFGGQAALDLLRTETAVMGLSGQPVRFDLPTLPETEPGAEDPRLQVLTEAAVRNAAQAAIDGAGEGDAIRVAQFYLTHRGTIEALKRARSRGVEVRVILDPNKDAFGRQKSGLPNRQVAMELKGAGAGVRWCATQGEQCHSKLMLVSGPTRQAELIMGSANFTRRNLDNYNLETDIRLVGPEQTGAITDAARLFDRRWSNAQGRVYTRDYEVYADDSEWRYWQYRIMEFTGWSTF